ncbi:hypothetical protein LJ707_18300 [Mucilaginibacter sp. UR6-1]|uniref:hypothetical protein n=1 Tax=Mucilaginibacter sp. UR6-1 TaxID=1435643 RepID=UPI001E56CBCE|nr:hypothetical protein [Mucilaginibacter sp. UR6-1]MCC8410898.1 hypothetical protein [Mucilaginibacter sp. UR6-1]
MKALIKYISLLIFSGLIIPLYFYYLPEKNNCLDTPIINALSNQQPIEKAHTYLHNLASIIFPVIKKFE